ncbi:MAG: DUF2330 domain-containing protein [Myxococcota bacterium]
MILFLLAEAHAFCGTYVGEEGASLVNRASQVVLARYGEQTTLSVAMDYEGAAAEFGLLLPVPQVLTAENVKTVDPQLFARLDEFSTPRQVAYTCDDVVTEGHDEGSLGCMFAQDYALEASRDAAGAYDSGSTVVIESEFSVAGYDIVVLSAEEADGLTAWLDDNGYSVPSGGEAVLQEYISGGSYFLAAKVSLELTGESAWLPPLQFTYESDVLGLPIRIGTISADGPQEVVIYGLSTSPVAIANYAEAEVEDECMWKDDGDGFAAYYEDQLDAAFADEASWVREYEWSLTANCDPCTRVSGMMPEELAELGLPEYHGYLTRLRMRYTPDQATQDVVLYETSPGGGDTGWGGGTGEQIRYIDYVEELEYLFPVCGEGMVENPGTCLAGEPQVGCAARTSTRGAGVAVLLLAAAAIRRRR